jgi:hypothetical protein
VPALKEEHILRVFENRVLRRIFGPKREEVAGDWKRLHSKELRNLFASPNVIRVIKLQRKRRPKQLARKRVILAYKTLVGKNRKTSRKT